MGGPKPKCLPPPEMPPNFSVSGIRSSCVGSEFQAEVNKCHKEQFGSTLLLVGPNLEIVPLVLCHQNSEAREIFLDALVCLENEHAIVESNNTPEYCCTSEIITDF